LVIEELPFTPKPKEIKKPTGQQQNGMHQMQDNQTSPVLQKKYLFQIQSLINPELILHLI